MSIFRTLIAGGLLIALVAAVIPMQNRAVAQDGGDDTAIIERLMNVEPIASFASYTLTSYETSDLFIDISFAGFGLASTENTDFVTVATIIRDDGTGNPNLVVTVTGTTNTVETGFGQDTTAVTTVVAEFRLVGGALYLNVIEQATDDEDIELLPTGWLLLSSDVTSMADLDEAFSTRFEDTVLDGFPFSIIADVVSNTADELDVDDGLLDLLGDDEQLADLLDSVLDLSLKQEVLPDGRTVDAIGLGLDFATLMSLASDEIDLDLAEEENPAMTAVLESMFSDLVLDLDILLDDQDRLAGYGFDLGFGFDADAFAAILAASGSDMEDMEGIEMAADIQMDALQVYSDYNADFALAEAPADAVPFE